MALVDEVHLMALAIVVNLILFLPSVRSALDTRVVDCAFAHPQYAGTCVEQVTPAENQTPVQACRTVLGCLNNTQCVKTYCQNTTIRGGWSLVSAKVREQ